MSYPVYKGDDDFEQKLKEYGTAKKAQTTQFIKNLANLPDKSKFTLYDLSEVPIEFSETQQILFPMNFFQTHLPSMYEKIMMVKEFSDSYKLHPTNFYRCNIERNCAIDESVKTRQEVWTVGVFILRIWDIDFKEITTKSLKCPHITIDLFCLQRLYELIRETHLGEGNFLIHVLEKLFEQDPLQIKWSEVIPK